MSNLRDLVAAALGWLVKTESPDCSTEIRQEFERWAAADVRHRVALAAAKKAREKMGRLDTIRPPDGRAEPDPLPAPEYTRRSIPRARGANPESPPSKREFSAKWKPFGLAALIVGGICGGLVGAGWFAINRLHWEAYATHVGGKETAPLPDGSTITLNTDSELRARMTPQARELDLVRGEVVIKAARHDKRPFRLIVGKTELQTDGADFCVRRHDSGEVDLIVSEGRVTTEPVESAVARPFHEAPATQSVIFAGYMAAIRPGDVRVSLLNADERARRTAWLHDAVDFRGETLAQAIEEFNRYNRRKIVIDDPAIAGRRVGGVFRNTDPESFVAALAVTMNIRATTVGGEEGPGYGTIRLTSARTPVGR